MNTEVERWWDLLAESDRRVAWERWRSRLNRAHRRWLDTTLRDAEAAERRNLLRPARVLTWWTSRDAPEQNKLAVWWRQLPREVVLARLRQWLDALPEAAKLAVRWPDWDQLSSEERRDRLANGFQDLPTGLWHLPMAWLTWQEKSPEAKAQAARDEVGRLAVLWAQLRYGLRPVDRRLGFRLPEASACAGLAVVAAVLLALWRRGRGKGRIDVSESSP